MCKTTNRDRVFVTCILCVSVIKKGRDEIEQRDIFSLQTRRLRVYGPRMALAVHTRKSWNIAVTHANKKPKRENMKHFVFRGGVADPISQHYCKQKCSHAKQECRERERERERA